MYIPINWRRDLCCLFFFYSRDELHVTKAKQSPLTKSCQPQLKGQRRPGGTGTRSVRGNGLSVSLWLKRHSFVFFLWKKCEILCEHIEFWGEKNKKGTETGIPNKLGCSFHCLCFLLSNLVWKVAAITFEIYKKFTKFVNFRWTLNILCNVLHSACHTAAQPVWSQGCY